MISVQDLFMLSKEGLILIAVAIIPVAAAVVLASVLSSAIQYFTKVSEPILSAVPRIAAGTAALFLTAPWIASKAAGFANRVWSLIQAIN